MLTRERKPTKVRGRERDCTTMELMARDTSHVNKLVVSKPEDAN